MKNKIFIEKLWVQGDTCLFNIQNYSERLRAKAKLSRKRQQFVEKLQSDGFRITFENNDIDENTICFTMDSTSVASEDIPIDEYKHLFDQKIVEGAGVHFHYPFSMRIEEYFYHPFFPAVFKNELANGGDDKFLIENIKQMEILKSFYEKKSNNPIYEEAFKCSIFQQYLTNPGNYATYLRVLMSASGDVMGASLKYCSKTITKPSLCGVFDKIFLNPDSEYFLEATKLFNYYSGGGNISFFQPRYSDEKVQVLTEHGFDVQNLQLPGEVLDVCKNIMENCNREVGILCGIDFMLNENDGLWYYLENQAFPAIDEWAQVKGITIPSSHNINGYLRILDLDLQARYEALLLLINKINDKNNNAKKIMKK